MRVPLTGGAYTARSIIANCQRAINLYAEKNPGDDEPPVPVTQYPCPGLVLLGTAPDKSTMRGLYTANTGDLYAVNGGSLYYVDRSWNFNLIGSIAFATTPVSMIDNGTVMGLVDGTTDGYSVVLATKTFAPIVDPTGLFTGSDFIDYIDTFFLFNQPGTPQLYLSLSNSLTFNALDFANKTGYADNLVRAYVMHREAWVIGQKTTEVWYDSGAADFALQEMPGVFIEQGCAAKYSIAKYDTSLFWLSQNINGDRIVLEGHGYEAHRISTHAIEEELRNYAVISDAVGYCYQQGGHAFYVLSFPTADKTWVFDKATGEWHERAWMDAQGNLHRHRGNCATLAYGKVVVGDHSNGNLYAFDLDTFTDNGEPMQFIRSFPHIVDDAKRVFYQSLIADMQVGTDDGSLDDSTPTDPPLVSLRWSDTRGATWSSPITQSLGNAGNYLTSVQFQRLGMARDRVFELSWSCPIKTALQGAWIQTQKAQT